MVEVTDRARTARGPSILIKQVAVYLLLIILVLGVTAQLFLSTARAHLEDEIGRRLEYVARIAARYTPVERLDLIRADDDEARMVLRLEQKLAEIREATGVHGLYVFRPDRTALLDVDPAVPIGATYRLAQLDAVAMAALERNSSVHSSGYVAVDGELRMSAFAPILGSSGDLVAVVGVDADTRELEILERMRDQLYWIAGICAAVAVAAALLLARSITGPIRHIAAVAERLGRGEYEARAAVRSRDEVGGLAESVNRMAGQIRDRDGTLKEMAASVAHEIRNPLNSIQLLLTLLAEDLTDGRSEGNEETIRTLRYEVGKLNRFVDEFLTYSRPITLMEDQIEPDSLVAAVVEMASGEARQRDVDLVHEAGEDGACLTGDRQRLEQSLLNLVINAVQAAGTEGEGKRGRVAVRAVKTPGGVALTVEDTGPGVGAEDGGRLFEPFFTTKTDGTGLGLANAVKIAAAHGGSIEAHNRPDGGAVFTLHLPAGPAGPQES